ncbi:MAG: DUF1223 domain-containing protein [Rhodobacter sp.]|nr:DUF1223 domain-containing protein [Paracoccaceae bacterium]MCC0077865.1 DUF1223 domain-containing protein [Rhodobacter sp.]
MTLNASLRAGQGLRAKGGRQGPLHRIRRVALACGVAALIPGTLLAQDAPGAVADHPVLLELYTAQGCASCPPADDMMIELAGRDDVIALALHVDYWDYIGWADTFAARAYTERQQRYARRHGHSTIYTPQVVINGTEILEGYRVMQVMDAIASQHARAAEVALHVQRVDGGGLEIRAEPLADAAPVVAMASRRVGLAEPASNAVVGTLSMGAAAETVPDTTTPQQMRAQPSPAAPFVVQLVRYMPAAEVSIEGGENAGRVAEYANIVTSWQTVGSWDMRGPLQITVPLEGDEPAVVIVQEAGQGEIIAAARLN